MDDDVALDGTTLDALLARCPGWTHGPLRATRVREIGTDRGYAGRVFHVAGRTADGGREASCVVKLATSDAVARTLAVHALAGEALGDGTARLLGGVVEFRDGRGALVLEDLTTLAPGDVLAGCTPAQACDVLRVLARLHAATWETSCVLSSRDVLPVWDPQPLDAATWRDRLARAAERHPTLLGAGLVARLADLPARLPAAVAAARQGPRCVVHADVHLDNVLLGDGRVVLLDWDGARIGPPALDVLRALLECAGPPTGTAWAEALAAYLVELRARGVRADARGILVEGVPVVVPLLQGVLAAAGRPGPHPAGLRMEALFADGVAKLVRFVDG